MAGHDWYHLMLCLRFRLPLHGQHPHQRWLKFSATWGVKRLLPSGGLALMTKVSDKLWGMLVLLSVAHANLMLTDWISYLSSSLSYGDQSVHRHLGSCASAVYGCTATKRLGWWIWPPSWEHHRREFSEYLKITFLLDRWIRRDVNTPFPNRGIAILGWRGWRGWREVSWVAGEKCITMATMYTCMNVCCSSGMS